MHAAQHDDLGIGLGSLPGQRQRITREIGDAMEYFRRLVVVAQDDGLALALETQDGIDLGREGRPFECRNHALHPLVQGPCALGHLRRELQWFCESLCIECRHFDPLMLAVSILSRKKTGTLPCGAYTSCEYKAVKRVFVTPSWRAGSP